MSSYCTKCGTSVSDTATYCPNCGFELQQHLPLSPKSQSIGLFKWLGIIVFAVFCLLVIEKVTKDNTYTKNNIEKTTTEKWYVGGTLHKATIAEWRIATDKNKLATCSDFIAKIRLDKGIAFNETEILAESYALKKCIDAAQKDVDIATWKVVDLASLCLVELGYK